MQPLPPYPQAAQRHNRWSALLAVRAVREATKARAKGPVAVASVVATHQIVAAAHAQAAVTQMLAEQDIAVAAEAMLNSSAFATQVDAFMQMLDATSADWEFDRLVSSIVQDAARTAESVAVTTRPDIGYVRVLTPPSCSRCAVLAGRVYRYSTGFQRHPGCDCTMLPVGIAHGDHLAADPVEMMRAGQITDLSKADRKAIADGADFGRVVNSRLARGGVRDSGLVLDRAGRPTPAAIYRDATSREDALKRLAAAGYIR